MSDMVGYQATHAREWQEAYATWPELKAELAALRAVADAARALSVALPYTVGWDEYERLFGVMVAALEALDGEDAPDA